MLSYVAASRQTMTAAPHPMSLWGSATDCQGRRAQGQGRGTFPLVHFLWVTKVFVTCTTQAGNIHWKGEHTHTSLSLSLSLSLFHTHTHIHTHVHTRTHIYTHRRCRPWYPCLSHASPAARFSLRLRRQLECRWVFGGAPTSANKLLSVLFLGCCCLHNTYQHRRLHFFELVLLLSRGRSAMV